VITQVPEVGNINIETSEQLISIVKHTGKRKSTLNSKIQAEGIVCRVSDEPKLSFKYINPDFLLKWDKVVEKEEAVEEVTEVEMV
jgi:hypothetical protein